MRTARWTSLILALSAMLAFGLAARAQQPSTKLILGANGHPFSAYAVSFDAQIDLLADLGLTHYRVDVRSIANFPALDRLITAAKRRGITILPVLTPDVDLNKASIDEIYKASFALASAAVRRYRDVRVWELGNEIENYAILKPCEKRDDGTTYSCEWGPAGGLSPLDYHGQRWAKAAAMLKGLSEGAFATDPTVRRAIGTAGWGHIGAYRRMQDSGVRWDISVWHMYGQDPEWAFKELAAYGKPIWVTEFNHPMDKQPDAVEVARGLDFWIGRLRELSRTYPLEAAFVYELLDEPYWAPSTEAVMGIVGVKADRAGAYSIPYPKPSGDMVKRATGRDHGMGEPVRPACLAEPAVARSQSAYADCLLLSRRSEAKGASQPAKDVGQAFRAVAKDPAWLSQCPPDACGDMSFVRLVYRKMLLREPDVAGQDAYARALLGGMLQREDVLLAMTESREFRLVHPALFGED